MTQLTFSDLVNTLKSLIVDQSAVGTNPESLALLAVTSDSRTVKNGSVFVAISGGQSDGHQFIEQVIRAGAVAIIGQQDIVGLSVPYFRVTDSRLALAKLSAQFFGHPSHRLKMIGVTGTSGKTTTTYLIESILKSAGEKVGVIGTVNTRYLGRVIDATHTTPGPFELQMLLREMLDAGVTAVVMEVSSHALDQSRVGDIAFDAMAFLNLSPEHLDYHPTMEHYYESKKRLFFEYFEVATPLHKNPQLIVNYGNPYGKRLADEICKKGRHSSLLVFTQGERFSGNCQVVYDGEHLKSTAAGITGEISGIHVRSDLVGSFNIENILAAVAVARALGLEQSSIENGLSALKGVPGRLERVENQKGYRVWVDYAHKPDALEKVLQVLAPLKAGSRLITVFGCGGDRDRQKRPVMGAIASKLSDVVIVTSDNPRTENPEQIIQEIVENIDPELKRQRIQVLSDRRQAIAKAIEIAQPHDLILIAGKGHETYQIIGTQKSDFDDREVAKLAIESLTRVSKNQ
jgi:UDP-N-acetylmuramoyl-L-alanyl-D-glutamate--2,6-diaminopimelate ligase